MTRKRYTRKQILDLFEKSGGRCWRCGEKIIDEVYGIGWAKRYNRETGRFENGAAMTDDLTAIREKMIRAPVADLRVELEAAEALAANLRHRIKTLEMEVTARNAANRELGEQLAFCQQRLRGSHVEVDGNAESPGDQAGNGRCQASGDDVREAADASAGVVPRTAGSGSDAA